MTSTESPDVTVGVADVAWRGDHVRRRCSIALRPSASHRRTAAGESEGDFALGVLGFPRWENWRMSCTKTPRITALGLVLAAMNLAVPANATTPVPAGSDLIVVAQAMIPRTGMTDAENPMPMKERYQKRFPQPARVRDLIGMPVIDLYSKTLGYVRHRAQFRRRDPVHCRL